MGIVVARSLLVVVLIAISAGESFKILGVFPSPGYSQFVLAERLMTELAERGHEVTVISPFQPKRTVKNYKTILLRRNLKEWSVDLFTWQYRNPFYNLYDMYATLGLSMTENALSDPKVQALINSDETFDLVLSEIFANEAHMAFAPHFDAPLVLFSSIYPSEWTNSFVGNPAPPSYASHSGSGYISPLGISQRVGNLFYYAFEALLRELYLYPKHEELMRRYFPNPPSSLRDVIYNVSLVLLNSHPSYTEAVPLVPNMVEIAGFHVAEEALPEDLKQFLDDAEEGVVYFSMGSNLKSRNLSPVKRKSILDAFRKLPVKVLWKFEEEDLPGKPGNVKIAKWFPQRGVLNHTNVKAFISHCGFISTTEAVYFGVPLVCVPIYVDQLKNAAFSRKNGMAVVLEYEGLSEETLRETLEEVLNNKSYSTNAKLRSKMFHDRPVKPIDATVYWIEYVIRNRGAAHLKSVGLNIRWYQFLYLDVISLAAATLAAVYIIMILLLRKTPKQSIRENKKKRE